jgi:hypothetical protein
MKIQIQTQRNLNFAIAILGLVFAAAYAARADPLLTSWFTDNSGKYARIYTSTANRTAGISSTTWSTQSSPIYAGVHEIDYSANWVYIRNSGLASFVMGPWGNPNMASNQGGNTPVYRFPRGAAEGAAVEKSKPRKRKIIFNAVHMTNEERQQAEKKLLNDLKETMEQK